MRKTLFLSKRKNSFLVEKEKIVFRRAHENDNFEEIAELIYDTDPYIYPFWFQNNKDEAIIFLTSKFQKKDLYSIMRIYIYSI